MQDALAVVDRRHTRELRERNDRVHDAQSDLVTQQRENEELRAAVVRKQEDMEAMKRRTCNLEEQVLRESTRRYVICPGVDHTKEIILSRGGAHGDMYHLLG